VNNTVGTRKSESREDIVTDELLVQYGTTTVRRPRLAPGEAMPWHRDPCHFVAVVLGGDFLSMEYGDRRAFAKLHVVVLGFQSF
jgi:hypothetical protein